MILISNLILSILDGSTIASTEIYGANKKTYINIGSGNVFKLTWKTELETNPVFTNDIVDHYNLVIKRFDPTLSVYYDIFDKNVGLINEFYVNSEMLPSIPLQYILSIYVVAYGKLGNVLTSNVTNSYVCKGSGAYVKVQPEGYTQPIMKRALAFAKTAQAAMSGAATPLESVIALATDSGELLHTNKEDEIEILVVTDSSIDSSISKNTIETELVDKKGVPLLAANGGDGEPLAAVTTKLLYNVNGWDIMQESYSKGDDKEWHASDVKFEVLVAKDTNNVYIEPLEVIIGNDTNGNPIYEPLYVL